MNKTDLINKILIAQLRSNARIKEQIHLFKMGLKEKKEEGKEKDV